MFNIFRALSCPSFPVCSDLSAFGSKRYLRTLPEPNQSLSISVYSPHHVVPSRMLFAPSSQLVVGVLSSRLGPSHLPFFGLIWLILPLLMQRNLLAAAHLSIRCLPLLVHEGPLFLWLGFEFFTILPPLHQRMKAGCIWQKRTPPLFSVGLCWP